jgi:hypothetical protein
MRSFSDRCRPRPRAVSRKKDPFVYRCSQPASLTARSLSERRDGCTRWPRMCLKLFAHWRFGISRRRGLDALGRFRLLKKHLGFISFQIPDRWEAIRLFHNASARASRIGALREPAAGHYDKFSQTRGILTNPVIPIPQLHKNVPLLPSSPCWGVKAVKIPVASVSKQWRYCVAG